MASSICGCMMLTRCLRRISQINGKYSFSTSPILSTLSKKLLLNNAIVYQTTAIQKNVWGTSRWRTISGQSQVDSKVNEGSNSTEDERKKAANLQWRATKYGLLSLVVLFACSAGWILVVWGSPPKDEDGQEIKDEYSDMVVVKAYLYRAWRELLFYNKMIQDPSREKLLPDPVKEPYYQPPYTLVLEMTDVLVHPDWTYKTGWRFKKRPGVNYFLQQVSSPWFEIVVYTSEQGFTAYPILDSLDPNGLIAYKLFRDATRYHNGHHVKDLSCLNRDLSKVIMVDWNAKSVQLNPENALHIKKWSGNDDDSTLFDLAIFLKTLANSEVEDVRTVLQFYQQFDDPISAFKENQRRLQEEQEKVSGYDRKTTLAQTWSNSFFGRRR